MSATAEGAVVWDSLDRSLGESVAAFERRVPDDVSVIAPHSTHPQTAEAYWKTGRLV